MPRRAMLNYMLTVTALKEHSLIRVSADRRAQTAEALNPAAPSRRTKRKFTRAEVLEKRRRIAYYFTLALVFIRFSMIHQLLAFQFHLDLYLLYVVGIPVIIGIIVTGRYKTVFQYRPGIYWTAFALWLIPASIFSTWKGGSFVGITTYYRTELILLFAIAGLASNWKECRWLIYTVASAALVNIASFILFGQVDENGRTSLAFGTVANSNDYAAHLILVLPFVLWTILTNKSLRLRIACFLVVGVGIYQILASASRGAMIGLIAGVLVFSFAASWKVRKTVLIAVPLIAVLVITLLPSAVVQRILSFSQDNASGSVEALESSRIREELLKDSIRFTFEHPVFGLGPGQFSANEGKRAIMPGESFGLWFQTHNSFTQISSENGIPALILFVCALISSLLLLNKTDHLCRGKPGLQEITAAVLCLRIALISFCATIFFLNFGYSFYLPAMSGIAIAMAAATEKLAEQESVARKWKRKLAFHPLIDLTRRIVSEKK
jgi:O-Antigen ligase